ncbi:MAG TPA: bifunctional nuclease family protein [Flavobacteriales bacterium]|nr:bifunctional nuclease family protein [Flavobacteriales bacterium]
MEKVELKFVKISYSHTHHGAYALVLSEVQGSRRILIVIGSTEAQAIAIYVEGIKPARPLTHDLFRNACSKLDITLKEVVITDLVEGIFHAKLLLEMDGKTAEVDARSSDAIALALRFACPIYTYEFILAAAGVEMEGTMEEGEHQAEDTATRKPDLQAATPQELEQMLHEALEAEDYEGASKLRDEIKRREGTN